jgi:hypothetical protein
MSDKQNFQRVSVRVRGADKAALNQQANERGCTVTDVVRELIRRGARRCGWVFCKVEWMSGCGVWWDARNGSPDEYDMQFCPFCGYKITTEKGSDE